MAADESVNIETTSTRLVYENRWMRVREDMIRRGIYGVVEKPDFVVIVPVEDDGRPHLVEQYRYPVKGRYWELRLLGAGTGGKPDGNGQWRIAGGDRSGRRSHDFEACGYANQGFHIFLATGLRQGEANRGHEEQDLVTQDFALSEVERMIRDGEIKDATTVAALGLLRLKGLL